MKRYFKNLSVEKLHSYLDYQRVIKEDFVKEKVAIFDINEVDAPAVSLRINKDGEEEYRVGDGQHTIAIVKYMGWKVLKCEVREGLTDEEEHEWFHKRNSKKRPQTSGRMLNAKVKGKFDQATNSLVNILDSVGYKIKTADIKNGNGVINAGLTMEDIFKSMGESNFKQFIILHSNVWNSDKKAMNAHFLKGMAKFYITYKDEIEDKRFIQAFLNKKVTASDIIKDVSNNVLKKDNSIKYAWVFVENYNKGLKDESKKLKFSKLED